MESINEHIEDADVMKVKKFIMKTLEEMVNDPRFEEIVKEVSTSKNYESEDKGEEAELL